MSNLFKKAKKVEKKTSKSKDEKVRVLVDTDDFFQKIEDLELLQDSMKRDKARADMIADEIKEIGRTKWSDLYKSTGKNPGSIMLENVNNLDTAQVMFVPSDKYITIDEERSNELSETYGDDIVTEETKFEFDSKMIEKYGEVLSDLIMNSPDISESDKEKIIKSSTKYSISKGTIDKLDSYGEVFELLETVKPVISLKNVSVIRG